MDRETKASGASTRLEILTLSAVSRQELDRAASSVFDLFVEREAEFGVHPSVILHSPDLTDDSAHGFLADAAHYVAALAETAAAEGDPVGRIVVLTTYAHHVAPAFEAAGYRALPIDMPAGPDHTCAFVLGPAEPPARHRTLYVEAVNEADEKIRPTFVLRMTDDAGRLCAGACGSVHERDGRKYVYLATLTTAPWAAKGTGTKLAGELLRFLRGEGAQVVHLGTQTAARFYQKIGFEVEHRLVRGMRTRVLDGSEIRDDLVMLSMRL